MTSKYSKSASKSVEKAMHKEKEGTLYSGKTAKAEKLQATRKPLLSAFLKLEKKVQKFLKNQAKIPIGFYEAGQIPASFYP